MAGGGADRPTPRVLAVDDWAWRRGHRYGTVLVDLERNRVVDLLPDRQAGTLASWLCEHPGVEVIARDRVGAYADGARQGAPEAVQVADRWHLLRNLSMAVRALAGRHDAAARRAAQHVADEPTVATPEPTTSTHGPSAAERASQASLARRQARYEEAARLQAQGMSISRIAALLGADRKTVRRWLRLGHAPLWAKPRRGGALDAYMAHLDRRWAEGCRNAAQLWRELVAMGFPGRSATVRAWATRRRRGEPDADPGGTGARAAAAQPPPASQIARLLMADTDALAEGERGFVARLLAEAPGLADAVAVAKRLNRLLWRKSEEKLDQVLEDAADTQLAEFASGLKRDLAAIQAALDTPWTTSPAEGQINRIKTIKRSMYGRAGFPLLRARVLNAA
jgi:transposase